jgi:hypothetical protein
VAERCFVDYAGKKPRIVDPTTGEVIAVERFVVVLGASNYTCAEATGTQQVPDRIAAPTSPVCNAPTRSSPSTRALPSSRRGRPTTRSPTDLVHEVMDVRVSATTVEIFHRG